MNEGVTARGVPGVYQNEATSASRRVMSFANVLK